ncbi:ABC transporter permease [Tenacibaculum ovolyticum]|uniref:ABC transporter permease n=1 Tax=Tenacibaculum ovolyticum TaxID=104270 RepID=UPI0022F38D77|nr:ABC transporter permease [Tenacibaculum ovolyticum]WBX74934.1 ABC transporter permease [Tenacibaculum ovolyticum]
MLQIWFKIFFRNQQKNWLNALINISGLTLGLAGLLIVLLYLNEEQSYNQWNPNKEEIYRVNLKQAKSKEVWFTVNAGMYLTYPKELPEVTEALMVQPFYRSRVVQFNDTFEFTDKVTITDPQFFNFFPFEIIDGSTQKFTETRAHIGLSKLYAERIFKGERAVGNSVKIGTKNYIVACVYNIPKNSHQEPDLLIQFDEDFEVHWGNHNNELFCKVTKGTNLADLKQKMNQIIINKAFKPAAEENGITVEEFDKRYGIPTVLLDKLSTIYLHNTAKRAGPSGTGNYQLLMVLLGLSILLIVISCVNFINLSVASATQRSKEVGVKKTLGLSKRQLLLQYIFEVVFQGIISFILALIIVELTLPFFNDFVQKDISILNVSSLSTLFITAILISIFIGSIPALYLSNFKAIEVLKGSISKSKKGNLARNIMLGLQFLISGFFIISMLIVGNQINYMMQKELGFDKEQVLSVKVYNLENKYKKYELTKDVLSKNKNILAVSSSMFVPGDGWVSGTSLNHKINDIDFNSASNTVDYNYINFAKIKILKGRNFSEDIASDTISKIIINESAAKKLGIYNDPIGQILNLGWQEDNMPGLEVIGMTKDYHFDGFDTKIAPMFFVLWDNFDFTKSWMSSIQFKIKPENIDQTIVDIEEFWKQNVDAKFPFTYEFLDQKFAETYDKYQKQQTMFLILSVFVILISLLGLFALATLTIQQRLKEVAIRKTLGASVKEIMFQLLKSFLNVVLISSVILIPIAYYFMQNWLNNFVYRIEMPILPFIITPIILIGLVFIVVGLKAYKATKIDLIKYLKFE